MESIYDFDGLKVKSLDGKPFELTADQKLQFTNFSEYLEVTPLYQNDRFPDGKPTVYIDKYGNGGYVPSISIEEDLNEFVMSGLDSGTSFLVKLMHEYFHLQKTPVDYSENLQTGDGVELNNWPKIESNYLALMYEPWFSVFPPQSFFNDIFLTEIATQYVALGEYNRFLNYQEDGTFDSDLALDEDSLMENYKKSYNSRIVGLTTNLEKLLPDVTPVELESAFIESYERIDGFDHLVNQLLLYNEGTDPSITEVEKLLINAANGT